ncbi:hypothetical protein [Bacillus sp. YKCMOAS1]|uniref:hypothetical protein n=1 Tax=Bacillus sp. YKCMOAS1 TaxID=2925778 RepID=UPI00253D5FE9|nr:hypothetical protein [Bacillus sp. YKCMOAS1]GLJ04623.1 hypothetical protein OAS1_38700 [Bacillus sp. YKCMOAS1]
MSVIFRKLLIYSMIFAFAFTSSILVSSKSASAANREWVNLGKGYKAGFDEPHDKKTGKWHVHVYKGSKEIASENMDGTKHDGSTLKKAPKSVVKTLKSKSQWGKYKKKQKKLEDARKNVSKFSWWQLVWDPTPIVTLAVALGITFAMLTMAQWKAIIF